jgi:hypothetical protein
MITVERRYSFLYIACFVIVAAHMAYFRRSDWRKIGHGEPAEEEIKLDTA